MEYQDHVQVFQNEHPKLARDFAPFTGIDHVLQWMQQHDLAQAPIDLIGQDEFEYDFLLQFEPEGRWLAFGVT